MDLTSAQSCAEEEVTAGPRSVSTPALQHASHIHIQFVGNKESKSCHTAASGLLPAALWVCNCLVFVRLSESKSNLFTAPLLSTD